VGLRSCGSRLPRTAIRSRAFRGAPPSGTAGDLLSLLLGPGFEVGQRVQGQAAAAADHNQVRVPGLVAGGPGRQGDAISGMPGRYLLRDWAPGGAGPACRRDCGHTAVMVADGLGRSDTSMPDATTASCMNAAAVFKTEALNSGTGA
jgi:hypothetical protein